MYVVLLLYFSTLYFASALRYFFHKHLFVFCFVTCKVNIIIIEAINIIHCSVACRSSLFKTSDLPSELQMYTYMYMYTYTYMYMYIHVFTLLNMGVYSRDCVDSTTSCLCYLTLLVVYSLFVTRLNFQTLGIVLLQSSRQLSESESILTLK